jgi:nucleoside-diphosphate-sugar epimerase
LVTGGAGYIGAVLVPELLSDGYDVTVFDSMMFGNEPLAQVRGHQRLRIERGDLRDEPAVTELLRHGRFDSVIHLAAISNDPCSDLDADVTVAVNGRGTEHLMRAAKAAGVGRFLYASSASVYGIKQTEDVTEELLLEPITLYAEKKAAGEAVLNELCDDQFVGVSVRSATVCGYSPRLRLDLTINILTDHALRLGKIRVFGGEQMRPNVHITDLTRFYRLLLDADAARVNGQAFNVNRRNSTVMGLAEMIRAGVDASLPIEVVPTDDKRSYHLSGGLAERELGFIPEVSLDQAVRELAGAYREHRVEDPERDWYRNVKWMQAHPEVWRS